MVALDMVVERRGAMMVSEPRHGRKFSLIVKISPSHKNGTRHSRICEKSSIRSRISDY
jgi:hypothetical protein